MAAWNLPAEVASWIAQLASVLHRRVAWRLLPLLAGALFAQGRQTVASWLRGGELGDDFRRFCPAGSSRCTSQGKVALGSKLITRTSGVFGRCGTRYGFSDALWQA